MTAPPPDATDVTHVRVHDESAPRPAVEDQRSSLLIADDDAVVRYRLTSALSKDFRIVAIAENATDAIALATEHQPDAALIDVQMPGGGARAAVPAIAAASPHTHMVILSADEIEHEVVELLNAGAIAYVRKGVAGDSIAQTLAQALRVDV
jgi:DNA-binding NarL/FixJ family response regulator